VDFVVCTLSVKKKIRAGFDMSDRTIPLLVVFRGTSLPEYELGSRGIELGRVFGIGSSRIIAINELCCEKKTLCSGTVINPLPGYD
jgi:hypothetical protein